MSICLIFILLYKPINEIVIPVKKNNLSKLKLVCGGYFFFPFTKTAQQVAVCR
jgi:hypothetical protein